MLISYQDYGKISRMPSRSFLQLKLPDCRQMRGEISGASGLRLKISTKQLGGKVAILTLIYDRDGTLGKAVPPFGQSAM